MTDFETPTNSEQFDLMHGLHELDESLKDYKKAEQYYEGNVPEFFASPRLRRRLQATGQHFKVNLAKTAVNVVADALEIVSVTVVDDDAATLALSDAWTVNEMFQESQNLHRRACEFGDAYLIVWPDDDDPNVVDMFHNDATNVRIIYSEENPRVKLFAIKKFRAGKTVRVNIYYSDRIEKWARDVAGHDESSTDWYKYYDDDVDDDPAVGTGVWPVVNPYGEIPVFHFRTDRPYGTPEHKDAYGPQDMVNKLLITQMSSVDYQGFPQRYALSDPNVESDEITDFDSNFIGDDAEATRETTNSSSLESGPGELWWLQGVKGVGQFAVADPSVFMNPLAVIVRLMAQTTTTPLHYFDPSGDKPSGESLRVANAPLVKKIKDRQSSFGSTWQQVAKFALKILGFENVQIDVRWVDPNVNDDGDTWNVNSAKIASGVPLRQVLKEAGYTDEQLDEWKIAEFGIATSQTLDQKANSLFNIGKAVQALGAGIGFGVVDAAQVKALIDKFFTEEY